VPEITTRGELPSRRVVVDGDLVDPTDGDQLYDAICREVRAQAASVELDLSGVELFGSTAINGLLKANQDAQRQGCLVIIVAASPLVRRVLEITSLTNVFRVHED
jgi:anti-anti-sigma factor